LPCPDCCDLQDRILELNQRLRTSWRDSDRIMTKRQLDECIQLQLEHQREHDARVRWDEAWDYA